MDKEFKVGDFVQYDSGYAEMGGGFHYKFTKIARVTKTKVITEDGREFTVSGRAWGAGVGRSGWGCSTLSHCKEDSEIKYVLRQKRLRSLSMAKKLEQYLDECKRLPLGTYDALLGLINNLKHYGETKELPND